MESGFGGTSLQSLPHLNGFINETVRFHPPVSSAGLRETLPEGSTVADRHIPGHMTVVVPVYSLHRCKLQALLPVHFLSLTVRFSFEAMNRVQMCLLKVILLDALTRSPSTSLKYSA